MTWNPDQNELDELLGAFALDAVEPEEAERLEDYLRENPRARAEVEEYREAAAFLAMSGAEAPAGLWDRIVEQIDQPPPGQPVPLLEFRRRRGPRPARRSTRRLWSWVAAAAAVVAVAGLTGEVVHQQNRLDNLQNAQAALSASLDPNAGHFDLQNASDGSFAMRLAVLPGGKTWIVGQQLPEQPSDKEYQLWTIDTGTPISVGTLGRRPSVHEFQAPVTGKQYALSVEPKGGSPKPTVVVAASPAIQ
jgi:anti-sigma-K factor RskA